MKFSRALPGFLFLTILVAFFALAGCEWGTEEDASTPTETVVAVPIPGDTVEIDADQQQTSAARPEGPGLHGDSKDETPPGVSQEDVDRINSAVPPGIGEPQPLGGAQNLSCRYHPVRNHSARAPGSTVSMFFLHFTVSDPGTLDAIWGLFNTPSFGASSTFLLEPLTGRCERLMPYDRKPWTQGAFNSVSESVEIICCRTGDPSRAWWMKTKIIREGLLAEMVADRLRARGLPNKLVDPIGCTPKAGWTDHDRAECGNTHWDVGKNFPFDVLLRQIAQRLNPTTRIVWQVRSGGETLRQSRAPKGYGRVVAWMAGDGRRRVAAAEARNGNVFVRKVSVAQS